MSFFTKGNKKAQEKATMMESDVAKTGFTPGPGSYNVTNGFEKIQRDM